MKKYIYYFLLCLSWACQNDNDSLFDVSVKNANVSFKAIAGGAVMYYKLPDDPSIYGIQITYRDCNGKIIKSTGSYVGDSIVMQGFIKEEIKIPIEIALYDANQNLSKREMYYFSTKAASAHAIFDENLSVTPYWNGFQVRYTGPEYSNGFIHIGKIGINPKTQQLDTLILRTEMLQYGLNKYLFPNTVNKDMTTDVVIWTEDYRGNRVKKEVYEKVIGLETQKLDVTNSIPEGPYDDYLCPWYGFYQNCLFDGDTKGIKKMKTNWTRKMHCFFSGWYVAFPCEYIIDMEDEYALSYLRLYVPLNSIVYWDGVSQSTHWGNHPNHVIAYGSNDKNKWDNIGEFKQPLSTHDAMRWNYASYNPSKICTTVEELEAAEPCYMEIPFEVSDFKYRYLKFAVMSVFGKGIEGAEDNNWGVLLQEAEIFINK